METKLKQIQTVVESVSLSYDTMSLADALWLSKYITVSKKEDTSQDKTEVKTDSTKQATKKEKLDNPNTTSKTTTPPQAVKKIIITEEVNTEASVHVSTQDTRKSGLSIDIKQLSPKLNQTSLYNTLRYFRQKSYSDSLEILDINKTVDIKADTNLFIPQYKKATQNRYKLIIILDSSDTMKLWNEENEKFIQSLKLFNLFRSIDIRYLDSSKDKPRFYKDKNLKSESSSLSYLFEADTLMMLVSDMVSASWRKELPLKLYKWQQKVSIFVIEMLDSHLWSRTALKNAQKVRFSTNRKRRFNQTLKSDIDDLILFLDDPKSDKKYLKLPIATMKLESLEALSKVVTGKNNSSIKGAIFTIEDTQITEQKKIDDSKRVTLFYENSTKIAHDLAHYLSVVPLAINVMKLVQKLLLPESTKMHLAEILTGGILDKEDELYVFYHQDSSQDGVRDIFLNQLGTFEYLKVIERLSDYVENHLDSGFSAYFQAILKNSDTKEIGKLNRLDTEFARINIKRLKRLGSKYEKIAKRLSVELEAIIPTTKHFQMGSEEYNNKKLIHKVVINYDFDMAKYPVTFEEYDLFCEDIGKVKPKDEGWGRGRRPVINVSWHDAKKYCEWLSEKTGENYRLPLEAEWEYMCRAGTTTKWSFGDNETEIDKYAWYKKNSNKSTHKVGEKLPNLWGLYDMHGHVWEWCGNDWIDSYANTLNDSSTHKAKKGNRKILRGGSMNNDASSCRSAYRIGAHPTNKYFFWGFRLLKILPSESGDYKVIEIKENQIKKEIELEGDITFICKECSAKYAIDCDELDWVSVDSDERQMGTEINYESYYERDCDICNNNMSLTFNCWEYPVGAENYRDVVGEGVDNIKGDCCLDLQKQDENESNYNENDYTDYEKQAIEQIKEWFFKNYEDPAEHLPYETREGGYQWIHGGPIDTADAVSENFWEKYSEEVLEKAIDEIGRYEQWSPIPQSEEEFQDALGNWAKKKADEDES